jgi:hypothetical protein
MRSWLLPVSASLLLAAGLVSFWGSSCSAGGQLTCPCFMCPTTPAVSVTVIDSETAGPVAGFVIEAVVNGVPIGEPQECTEEVRTTNACGFGAETGLYRVVASAPGYAEREAIVRIAEPAAGDVCCDRCIVGRDLTLELDPL